MLDIFVIVICLVLIREIYFSRHSSLFSAWVCIVPVKQLVLRDSRLLQSVDPTLLLTILTVAACLYELGKRRVVSTTGFRVVFAWHWLFTLFLVGSLMWTSAPQYGFYKAARFLVMNTLLLVAPSILMRERQDFERFARQTLVFVSLIYFKIGFFPSYETVSGEIKYMRAGFAYGAEGAAAAVTVASAYVTHLFINRREWVVRILCLLSLGVVAYGSMMAGTRAIILSMVLTVPLYLLLQKTVGNRRYPLGILILALVAVVGNVAPEEQVARVLNTFRGDASIDARYTHWAVAMDAFSVRPLVGLGIGGYAVLGTGLDERWFPHNIFLEALAELGVVGFSFLSAMVVAFWMFVFRILRNRLDHHSPGGPFVEVFIVASIASFLQALVTDDLADNRWFWLMMGLVAATQTMPPPVAKQGLEATCTK